jgi:membrane-associated phospholipid phosphatase
MNRSTSLKRFLIFSSTFLVLFVVSFVVFAEDLVAHKLTRFDTTVIDWVQSAIDPMNTRVMEFFTFIGSPAVVAGLVVLSVIVLYWQKKHWEALCMLVANVGGVAFNEVLKWAFHRQRPEIHRLITAHGYSFPSGHSMGAIVFYGMVAYFFCLFAKSMTPKVLTCVVCVLLIVMIGGSRIYLGVHYPSDVIAGFIAGGAWLVVCITGLRLKVERNLVLSQQ